MSSQDIIKSVSKKLKYYFEVKRLEDGFDLSGPDCPRLDHPPLRARPTLMYDGLHDRPLKHYFSRGEVRTTLTQFKTKGGSGGREENIKKLVENYMRKYNFVERPIPPKNSSLNSAYYNQNKKGGRRLKPELQGYGIPLRKSRTPHRGGYPVLRCVPSQYASKPEAHRLVNMASRLLLATETIESEDDKDKQSEKQRPKSAPSAGKSRKQDKLPALKQRQRPQTSKSRREHKIYTVDPTGKKVFMKYYDKDSKRGEDQPDSAYSTRPGSVSPTRTSTTETDTSDHEQGIKPWLRREMLSMSHKNDDDDDEWVRPVSSMEPHPPPTTYVVTEQANQKRGSMSSESSSESSTRSDRDRENRTTQTGGELLKDYEPSEKVLYNGKMIKYRIHVHTGDKTGASTKADIKITLVGDKGRTEEISLGKSRTHKITFQKGQEDIFDVESYFVGPLRKIFIGHDRKEMGTDWYLDHVAVKDMAHHYQYHINCDTWLSYRSRDKLTFRGFKVNSSSRFLKNEEEDRSHHYGDQQETHIAIVHTTPKVEQVPSEDARTLRMEPTGSPSRTSTQTQYSDRKRSDSSDDSDTNTTYTTSEVPSSTKYRSTDPRHQHVVLRNSPPKRRDNFFDQLVKEKDYSSVIESLSVTTDQDNKDDFESDRPVRTPRDRSHLGMTLRPVETIEFGEKDEHEDTPVRGQRDSSDSEDDQTLVKSQQNDKEDLFTAARDGDLITVKRILQQKRELQRCTDERGWSVVHVVAEGGHVNVIQWLTLQVSDLEVETPTGETPMHVAARKGHVTCMRNLCDMGASVSSKSYAGQTPLHVAAEHGQLDAVKYLVATGASLDVRDVSGNSPEDLAGTSSAPGAPACHRYLQQCVNEKNKPIGKLNDMRSSSDNTRRPLSARSESSVDSSSSSSSSVSSPSSSSSVSSKRYTSSHHSLDEEMNEKQKKQHNEEIMEKRTLYEEQQAKMATGHMSFMDSIRADLY